MAVRADSCLLVHQDNGAVVVPTSVSIDFAVQQKGMDFGNTGEAADRLTVDLSGAPGSHAWPLCAYTYLVLRKSTLRQGATCAHRRETVAFWHWFWQSEYVASTAQHLGFGVLPARMRQTLMARLVKDVTCNRQPAFTAQQATVSVQGVGSYSALGIMQELREIYSIVDQQVAIEYTPRNSAAAVAEVWPTHGSLAAFPPVFQFRAIRTGALLSIGEHVRCGGVALASQACFGGHQGSEAMPDRPGRVGDSLWSAGVCFEGLDGEFALRVGGAAVASPDRHWTIGSFCRSFSVWSNYFVAPSFLLIANFQGFSVISFIKLPVDEHVVSLVWDLQFWMNVLDHLCRFIFLGTIFSAILGHFSFACRLVVQSKKSLRSYVEGCKSGTSMFQMYAYLQ